jgi:hypothetical protein
LSGTPTWLLLSWSLGNRELSSKFSCESYTGWVKKNWHLCYSFEYQMYQFFFTHPVYYNKHKGMQVLKLLCQILFVQPYGREKFKICQFILWKIHLIVQKLASSLAEGCIGVLDPQNLYCFPNIPIYNYFNFEYKSSVKEKKTNRNAKLCFITRRFYYSQVNKSNVHRSGLANFVTFTYGDTLNCMTRKKTWTKFDTWYTGCIKKR